jgi:hypothetical protein
VPEPNNTITVFQMSAKEAKERAQQIIARADRAADELVAHGFRREVAEEMARVYWNDPQPIVPFSP